MSRNAILLKLIEQSANRLHGLTYRLTLNNSAAEELMQDLFAGLCQHDNLQAIENMEAYAVRCAMNLAFDWRRQQKRRLIQISDGLVDTGVKPPDFHLIQSEQFEQILDAIQQLNGQTRECFVLHYIEQMEYQQIAGLTQKTPQQVRGLCAKGIARIRKILNQNDSLCEHKEAVNE